MTKVLLVGNGAREHAIAEAIMRSSHEPEIYAFMGAKNPGIVKLAKEVRIAKLADFAALRPFADDFMPDFAVIGPEAPLEAGVVDFLSSIGVPSVGPIKALAKLETSKSFTRNLMKKYKIPGNPKFEVFNSMTGIREFLEELHEFVIKPDGLTAGKGVKVTGDHLRGVDDGVNYCKEVLETHTAVVIEEKLIGEEFSLQCISDGKTVKATPPAQDHKRAYDEDKGPNTGGMGSYSCENHLLPFLGQEHVDRAVEITQMVCDAIKKETGKEYKGVMYGGFILTKNGVRLIEYNARFGDPEAMNVLPIMKTDFIDVCKAVINGTLEKIELEFEEMATVCKYAVPEGYPDNPVDGAKVDISKVPFDAKMYFASVDQREDGLYMSKSRAIAFVGVADTIEDAELIAEKAVLAVKGPVFHRRDIGTKELLDRRVKHMEEVMEE